MKFRNVVRLSALILAYAAAFILTPPLAGAVGGGAKLAAHGRTGAPPAYAGTVLYDGVSEMALSGLFDTYSASLSAHLVTVALARSAIQSLHGLTLIPRYDFHSAPALDRLILPGGAANDAARQAAAAWSQSRGLALEEPQREIGAGGSAYDLALADLARTRGGALARNAGGSLFYPVEHLPFGGAADQMRALALPVLLSLLGVAAVFALTRRSGQRPAHRSA